jgi:hypothetical protein
MINNKTVTHCLNYFSLLEKNNKTTSEEITVSYFDTLQNIFDHSLNNDFAKNNIISTLYSKIKNKNLNISSFISDPLLLSFFSDYSSFATHFSNTYENELNRIKKQFSSIIDIDSLENQDEILSYCITESLIEYSKTDIKFISKINHTNAPYSTQLTGDIYSVKNEFDILPVLENKPFGLYIFNVPYQKMKGNSYKVSNSVCFVSYQSNGTTFFNLNSDILYRGGLKGNSLTMENIINKKHSLKIKLKTETENTSLSNTREKTAFEQLNILNKLSIISFAAICSRDEERQINENKQDCLIGYSSTSDKSLLPVVQGFKSTELPYISFDELRFKGKYSFLSKLDDLFENIINMDIVNFKSDRVDCYFELTMNTEESKDNYFGNVFSRKVVPTIFTKENFNQFTVKEVTYNKDYIGIEESPRNISPLTHSFIGTEKEIYDNCLNLAKMNKLTLYALYLSFYYNIFFDDFIKEMTVFINDHIGEIIEDDKIFKLLNTVGQCRNSRRNHSNASVRTSDALVSENNLSLSDSNLTGFNSDKKATHLISLFLNNPEFYNIFINDYGLNISEKSMFFIEHYNMNIQLDKEYKKSTVINKRKSVFFGLIDNKLDLELLNWYYTSFPLSIVIPTTAKQHKNIMAKLESFNIKVQDTSYATGYKLIER